MVGSFKTGFGGWKSDSGVFFMGKDASVIFKTPDFGLSSNRLSDHLKFRHRRRP